MFSCCADDFSCPPFLLPSLPPCPNNVLPFCSCLRACVLVCLLAVCAGLPFLWSIRVGVFGGSAGVEWLASVDSVHGLVWQAAGDSFENVFTGTSQLEIHLMRCREASAVNCTHFSG